jgi:hypothetical protein
MEYSAQTSLFMVLVFLIPYGCAIAAGALTMKLGRAASGVASLLGLAMGIYVFSLALTWLSAL